VLHDSHQHRLIINRCWLIYDLITKKFRPLHEFHIEICSYSGKLQDFVKRASEIIASEGQN
jgi:hypothetical protein